METRHSPLDDDIRQALMMVEPVLEDYITAAEEYGASCLFRFRVC
ncbi:MAG: hypothetical protein FD153_1985 [Rhodospirillaceae bacterium]|nr:MAG: hypothetical protein FD153_1985 [Rhodospirillaceae bacterium]